MPPRTVAIVLLALAAWPGLAADLPGFSFDYQITGDRSITPYQVFDDGTATFLQFRDPERIPSIFVRDRQGSRLVRPQMQGNYQRVAEVAERLELVSDRKTAAVISMHKRSRPPLASPQAVFPPGAENPEAWPPLDPPATAVTAAPRTGALTRTALAAPLEAHRPSATLTDSLPIARSVALAPRDGVDELQRQIESLRQSVEALSERIRPALNPVSPQRLAAADEGQGAEAPANRFALPARECGAPSSKAFAPPPGTPERANPAAPGSAAPNALVSDKDPAQVFVFEVQNGQRLSEAVRRFVASHRLELDWDTGGADFEIRYGFRVVGGTLEEVLFGVLSPFKLNAITRRGNSIVAVFRAA